jgi:hypothetical protein
MVEVCKYTANPIEQQKIKVRLLCESDKSLIKMLPKNRNNDY